MLELTADNNSAITIADNTESEFSQWLVGYLSESKELTRFEINAIIANFDKKNHDGAVFRSNIQTWLHSVEGRTVNVVKTEEYAKEV